MPRAVGSEAGNWRLAYWVGQRLRRGVDGVAEEVAFLQGRVLGATPAQRLSWLWRCGVAITLLAAETAVLTISNSKAGSPLTFVTSWLALVLMPRPVPRLLLVTGRLLAAIFTAAGLASLLSWAASEYSGLRLWSSVLTLANVAVWLGMTVWALAGFRRQHPRLTTSATSATEVAASVPVEAERNVPRITFSSVGGGDLAKREIRLAAANRFAGSTPQVVRNGVLLYGPQGTGKNLIDRKSVV